MEQIENKMVLDEYWERPQFDWDSYYDHLAEKDDERWEDNIYDD